MESVHVGRFLFNEIISGAKVEVQAIRRGTKVTLQFLIHTVLVQKSEDNTTTTWEQ